MNNRLRLESLLGWWITVFVLQGACLAQVCARTPEAAVRSAGAAAPSDAVSATEGYRVASVHWDPVMRESWARVVSCAHPERPGVLIRVEGGHSAAAPLAAQRERAVNTPVVRAGEIVQLWRQEPLLRIEVAGIAEQSGAMGERIHVRLLHRNDGNPADEAELTGVVRGHAEVEMQP
jgi:hypothetical protein